MGVHATYCLICGLPVQHDHYVATDKEDLWAIYRSDHQPVGHFPFGPEHQWLLRGVAVNDEEGPFFGSCEDGCLKTEDGEELYVGSDSEDFSALHAYCWNAAGQPREYNRIYHYRYTYGRTFLRKYQEQLFDFGRCVAQGDGWLLTDPDLPEGRPNRERIDAILGTCPPSLDPQGAPRDPANVAELLASDNWLFYYLPGQGGLDFWRFRNNVSPGFDPQGYPYQLWLTESLERTPLPEMERFEQRFFQAVQQGGAAVALAALNVGGEYHLILQGRDVELCREELAKQGRPVGLELEVEDQPRWAGYFESLYPRLVELRGY